MILLNILQCIGQPQTTEVIRQRFFSWGQESSNIDGYIGFGEHPQGRAKRKESQERDSFDVTKAQGGEHLSSRMCSSVPEGGGKIKCFER